MPDLDRIEDELRLGEQPPDDAVLVVRGGPLAAEKLLVHVHRQQRLYSYRGQPMASVSVSATMTGWTLEALLAGPLVSRRQFATTTVATLRSAGYELLATGPAPHFDIVMGEVSLDACEHLLAHFSAARDNPYKRRR
ncbi:MAG: hypothetical protein ABIO67_12655 [Mycobacteriales bacterium]